MNTTTSQLIQIINAQTGQDVTVVTTRVMAAWDSAGDDLKDCLTTWANNALDQNATSPHRSRTKILNWYDDGSCQSVPPKQIPPAEEAQPDCGYCPIKQRLIFDPSSLVKELEATNDPEVAQNLAMEAFSEVWPFVRDLDYLLIQNFPPEEETGGLCPLPEVTGWYWNPTFVRSVRSWNASSQALLDLMELFQIPAVEDFGLLVRSLTPTTIDVLRRLRQPVDLLSLNPRRPDVYLLQSMIVYALSEKYQLQLHEKSSCPSQILATLLPRVRV